MIRIALCDDDRSIAQHVEASIQTLGILDCSLDVFYDGKKLIDYISANQTQYNIYLMDIEMPELNGIEAATIIRRHDQNALILFITDHQEFVYDVFEVLPFRFLRKPVKAAELNRSLSAAVQHINTSGQLFFYNVGHEKHQLLYRDILFFESSGRKVTIHSISGETEIYGKIAKIAETVDKNIFAQTHVSFLVNLEYVVSIRQAEVILSDGATLPISKRYQREIKERHLLFMERRCGE